ncbi:hypothetical protein [Pseudomonas aeruginosa]|uniref:hypothetical protein n=1 Tax=Pseudomonas aeruginosa TaxID=287 RepID=UPI000BB8DBAB|nr:hypothetical protein [Pseudomonas aeruginosa]MBG6882029.1 hypothetical protein [Pseudomonas aeruginosa]MBI8222252.1 hypothetical protein [Pseudomonas aeruginosa]MBX6041133.1 hypothetical protein [Pseudomonas aeruginosa]MBX6570654.1 hypothetical protein [Pseudomonas aeruginosa]MBX6651284.1 hypothetical protein [Pseudomonas aeruginosa]
MTKETLTIVLFSIGSGLIGYAIGIAAAWLGNWFTDGYHPLLLSNMVSTPGAEDGERANEYPDYLEPPRGCFGMCCAGCDARSQVNSRSKTTSEQTDQSYVLNAVLSAQGGGE